MAGRSALLRVTNSFTTAGLAVSMRRSGHRDSPSETLSSTERIRFSLSCSATSARLGFDELSDLRATSVMTAIRLHPAPCRPV